MQLRRTRRQAPEMSDLVPFVAGAGAVALGFFLYHVTSKRRQAAAPGPMTPAVGEKQAADAPIGAPGDNLDDRLDEALQESFPTSDPVSIQIA